MTNHANTLERLVGNGQSGIMPHQRRKGRCMSERIWEGTLFLMLVAAVTAVILFAR